MSYESIRPEEVFEFRLESTILPDMARVGANQPNSIRIGPSLCRVGARRTKKKKKDAAPTRRQQRCLRVAASDVGVVAVLPRPCILAQNLKLLAALIVISFGKICGS